MKLSTFTIFVLVFSMQLAGCKKEANTGSSASPVSSQPQAPETEIKTAILAHLAHKANLNLQAFDTNIQQVTIQGEQAQAKVAFQVKGGPGVMELNYRLEKHEGVWAVIDSNPVDSDSSHPPLDSGQNPVKGAPPAGSHSLADTLKSFRDAAPESQQNLPPGHPPANSNGNSTPQ